MGQLDAVRVSSMTGVEILPVARGSKRAGLSFGLDFLTGATLTLIAGVVVTVFEVIHRYGYSYPSGPRGSIFVVSPFDEGVYTETASLMAHGYQLYSQIYSAQPPFLPIILSVVDRATASGLVEARWTILAFGLLAVVGAAAVAGVFRGWVAGGLAAILLAAAPEFLLYSHAIEEEIPMVALALVSFALAAAWWRQREFELAAASGFFFGLAMLTKFLAVSLLAPFAVIVVLVLWERRDRWLPLVRDIILFAAGAALPLLVSLLLWGQAEWRQMINDRLGATADQAAFQSGSSLHLFRIFIETDPGLAVIGALAAIALLVREWKTGLVLDSWLVATFLVLLEYHPLFAHHLAVILAPMAVVAGAALGGIVTLPGRPYRERANWVGPDPTVVMSAVDDRRRRRTLTERTRQNIAAFLTVAGLLGYVVLLPVQVSSYGRLLIPTSPQDLQLQTAARMVDQNDPTNDSVAASDPVICVLAARSCVPEMVDTSYVRVVTGKLSQAINYVRAADATVVVLSRGLCQGPYMDQFVRWVHAHYRLVAPPMGIDSPPYCPSLAGPTGPMPAHPNWPAGVYVLAGRGLRP